MNDKFVDMPKCMADSKPDCVNFIEMTKGYLKKITGFMNKK